MPGYKDERRFSGGLDYDSDLRYIAQEDYIDAVGIMFGPGNLGSVTNPLEQVRIPIALDSGADKVIGAISDIKRQAIIFFVFNSEGNHCILHYLIKTKTIEIILKRDDSIPFLTDFLNFKEFNKIHSANILDDILTWVDDINPPRKINIKRCKDFMQQLAPSFTNTPYDNLIATGSLDQREQFLNAIKYAPDVQPTFVMGNDPNRKTNYLREKMVQFRYRWIYDDNEKSVWSTGSYVSLPNGEENILGYFNNPSANNYIDLTVQTGHPTVSKIEVAVRFGNLEAWYRIDNQIRKYDNDNQRILGDYDAYTFRFYNDKVLIPISDNESLINYPAIPHVVKTQEIVDGNRLVYGNYIEGFDNPIIDVTGGYRLTAQLVEAESPYTGDRTSATNKFTICPINDDLSDYVAGDKLEDNPLSPGVDWYDQAFLFPQDPSLIQVGCTIQFHVDYRTHLGTPLPYTPPFSGILNEFTVKYSVVPNDLLDWPNNLRTHLREAIVALGGFDNQIAEGSEAYNGVPYYYLILENYVTISDTPLAARITSVSISNPSARFPSYKAGAHHKTGIIYYDEAGRDGGVLINDSMSIYVPYLPEIASAGASYSKTVGNKFILQLTIRHRPPEWATRYQIVYGLSNLTKYTQFLVKGEPVLDAQNNIEIDCTYIQDYITTYRPNSSLDFQPEPGDRLRFVANADEVAYGYVETKVLKYDAATKKLTVTPFDQSLVISQMDTPSFEGALAELFRVNTQTDDQVYYEIGEQRIILEAGTPDRRHAGDLSNQSPDLSIPAITELRRGDTYVFKRYFKNNDLGVIVESEDFSDLYDSKNIDINRIQAVTNSTRKRYEQGMRYGGRYFPGTETNDLLMFLPVDLDTLTTTYGPLNRFITIGYVLKAIQSRKLTTIYINRNMIFNPDGNSQISLTNQVLGTKDPSETDYGTDHPESVIKMDRQVFFYDVNNSCMVQDDPNGPASISQYKANTYFINKTNEINSVSDKSFIKVFTAIDKINNLLIVTFKDESGLFEMPEDTITYHYLQNRWKSRLPVNAECYGTNGNTYLSFMFGETWLNNADSQFRSVYFGAPYATKIKYVSNVDPEKVKTFDSLAISSNMAWASPNIGDISIAPGLNYPQGMVSRLLASKFIAKEGVLYSDYLRDASTPNMSQDEALVNGRNLKGQMLVQQIEVNTREEIILFGVIVHSTPSEKSK